MKYALVILAFGCVLVPGIGHGLWIGRWTNSAEPKASADKLAQIPTSISDWEGEELPVDAKQLERVKLAGHLSRRYTHRVSGQQVSIFIACDRPGPVSVHAPDVCYTSAGFRILGDETRTAVEVASAGITGEFFVANFGKPSASNPEFLRIYWAWNGHGEWRAPALPRLTFGGCAALYKLYVIGSYASNSQAKEAEETCTRFMQALLPELNKALKAPALAVP